MSKKSIKIGAVGCGCVSSAYYFPYLMEYEKADLVAVCDLNEERVKQCQRIFNVPEGYSDYIEMLDKADIEAVFILTNPGTHVRFALDAIKRGKHVLLQKPMAINYEDAKKIHREVKKAKVKCLVEPSDNSPLDPSFQQATALLNKGILGAPLWFEYTFGAPTNYWVGLSDNPYGAAAFFTKDSGGMLYDFPYAQTKMATLMGSCKRATGMVYTANENKAIVPDKFYDEFLAKVTDPHEANYWDAVLSLPKTEQIKCESNDQVLGIYEMESGFKGIFHAGRPLHPVLPGVRRGGLNLFGKDGNLMDSASSEAAFSLITTHKDLLPQNDPYAWSDNSDWYHIKKRGDFAKAQWPKPIPGGFTYYHESTRHFIECILNDTTPLINEDWGLHITEMMFALEESYQTGKTYEMETSLPSGTL